MLENWNTILVGQKVLLVPYEKYHVEKYHQWMLDPWLQECTASEPLSLEEEYDMQQSWKTDPKKCTFILLAKYNDGEDTELFDCQKQLKNITAMIGDVNLFFNDYEDEFSCEIEIMIAEKQKHRQGFATEALQLMMAYGAVNLHVKRFYCKIGDTNKASMKLFRKLGYVQCNYVEAFKEAEFEYLINEREQKQMHSLLKIEQKS